MECFKLGIMNGNMNFKRYKVIKDVHNCHHHKFIDDLCTFAKWNVAKNLKTLKIDRLLLIKKNFFNEKRDKLDFNQVYKGMSMKN